MRGGGWEVRGEVRVLVPGGQGVGYDLPQWCGTLYPSRQGESPRTGKRMQMLQEAIGLQNAVAGPSEHERRSRYAIREWVGVCWHRLAR